MKARELLTRLHRAMNDHDLEALLACFDSDYRSEQPAHPNRGFGGREQVEKNWSAMFEGIPDFRAELITSAADGESAWAEWRWLGHRNDGTSLDLRGMTRFGVKNGRIVSGRLYMEEVEEAGEDIDAAMRRLTRPAHEEK
jgi:ketosteroid isomerase-like protein